MDKLKLLQCLFGDDIEDLEKYLPFVDEAISTLDEREQCVLQKRFSGMTLKATGKTIVNLSGRKSPCEGVQGERVRQIEAKAFRKMKHPDRLKILRGEMTAAELIMKSFTPIPPSPELLAKAEEFKANLLADIDLSARTRHCMEAASIVSIGELILKTESELTVIKHFGRKSLNEIKETLGAIGLCLRYQ